MTTESTRVFLDHQLTPQVARLVNEVESAFPQKRLRIREYGSARDELREPVPDVQALARPDVTSWIAIWIKETLSDHEFNSTLAEELIHQLQAAQGFTNLRFSSPFGQELLRRGFALTSKLLDIHAHVEMRERQIDTDVLMRYDAQRAIELVQNMSKDHVKLEDLRRAKAGPLLVSGEWASRVICVQNFPDYLQYWSGIRLCTDPEIESAWQRLESFFNNYCRHLLHFWQVVLNSARPDLMIDLETYRRSQAIILEQLGLASHLVPNRFPTSGKELCLS